MSENILSVRDLSVHYVKEKNVVKAVNHLTFDLVAGETLGLVGETGAGKTTTALAIMNLVPNPPGRIAGGEIIFQGENVLKKSKHELRKMRGREVSMIFQDPMTSLNPVMTVGEQIAEVVRLHSHCQTAEAAVRAQEMLRMVGINEERYQDYPHQFSGGMKQRVVIAIALACNPKLLIADEPTTALDVTIQAQILHLMNELKREKGTSILFITHDLGVINEMADSVAVMYCGQVVEMCDAHTIFARDNEYSHPYTEGLMTSIPRLDTPVGTRLDAIPGSVPHPLDLPKGCKFAPRCKYATAKCMEEEPKLEEVEGNHSVRCFYPEKEGRHATK